MKALLAKGFLPFAVLQCIAVSIFAQGIGKTTGTLSGEAIDEFSKPLPGVIISVSGATGAKTTTTDADGKFIFPYLIPSIYSIRAELSGFTTVEQNDLEIRLAQRADISFKMKRDVHESVTITSESPVVDVKSTKVVTNISNELTQRIPIGRTIYDIFWLAPGVGGTEGGASGTEGRENLILIDGVNVSDVENGGATGSLSGIHGLMPGSGLPVAAIQEVQVQTGGFEPEYGESLGGVFNIITKRGGDSYHGNFHVYSTPQDSEDIIRGGYDSDTGGEIGGPILKNKLFFFAAYNLTRSRAIFDNDPEFPSYAELPVYTNQWTSNEYTLKATANLTQNHTLEFSASGDPGHRPFGNQDGFNLEAFADPKLSRSEWDWGSSSRAARWSGILNPRIFIEAQVARFHNHFDETPFDKSVPRIVDQTQDFHDVGGFGGVHNFLGNNLQYSIKLTNLWRQHQVRYGIEFQDISFSDTLLRTGLPFTTFTGQVVTDGYRVDIQPGSSYRVHAFLTPAKSGTTTKYLDWFAQDSWSVTRDLNVMAGIRWQRQQLKGDRAAEVTFGDDWAPRIGATYDYLKNDKSKLFFHYGRFFEKIPNYVAVGLNPKTAAIGFYSDANLTHFTHGFIFDTSGSGVEGFGSFESGNRTKTEYSNELVFGVEQEVMNGFSLGARFISRNTQNAIVYNLVNPNAPCVPLSSGGCIPPSLTLEDAVAGVPFVYLFSNQDGHIPGHPALIRDYHALEITAQKRLSDRWQILGSYTYSHLIGTYVGDNCCTDVASFAQSPILHNYEKGPLPNDIRHFVKFFGSYQWTGNLNSGVAFAFRSGQPLTKLGVTSLLSDLFARTILLSPRGGLGRTDPSANLDVHADYDFGIGKQHRIKLGFDVFNLLALETSDVDQVAVNYDFDFTPSPNEFYLNRTKIELPRTVRLDFSYSF